MELFKFDNISVEIDNKEILSNISFSIENGDKTLIFGKSGKGKSTILKLLLGFIQPTSGKIYYKNKIFDNKQIWEFRKNSAYISQNYEMGSEKVIEMVKMIFNYKHNKNTNYFENLYFHLDFFELNKNILDKNFSDLSGGEKQRILIIISLLLGRSFYLLDEITSALDKNLKNKIVSFFLEKTSTEVIVSHDDIWLKRKKLKIIKL